MSEEMKVPEEEMEENVEAVEEINWEEVEDEAVKQ